MRMDLRVDHTGAHANGRTVIGFAGYETSPAGKRHTRWIVCCDTCGRQVTLAYNKFNYRGCRSCRRRSGEPDAVARTQLLVQFRSQAKRRQLEWSLTDADALALAGRPCHFCGAQPRNRKVVGHRNRHADRPVIVYSGLDRLDPAQGYSPTNTVPCCFTCNRAKFQMSEAEFVAWVARVASHLDRRRGDATRPALGPQL